MRLIIRRWWWRFRSCTRARMPKLTFETRVCPWASQTTVKLTTQTRWSVASAGKLSKWQTRSLIAWTIMFSTRSAMTIVRWTPKARRKKSRKWSTSAPPVTLKWTFRSNSQQVIINNSNCLEEIGIRLIERIDKDYMHAENTIIYIIDHSIRMAFFANQSFNI